MAIDPTCMDDFDPDSLDMESALAEILSRVKASTDSESLDLLAATGRILACDVEAKIDVPGFRNSAMDGYAFRHADHTSTHQWQLAGSSLAGHPFTGSLDNGQCIRITTGAEVPADADTIVMQENASLQNEVLHFDPLPSKGQHIREKGSNIKAGTRLLNKGTRLGPAELGTLASVGIGNVPVLRQLTVACFSSGDELAVPAGTPNNVIAGALKPGMIHDSNRYMLMSLLSSPNVTLIDLGVQPDNVAALRQCMEKAGAADVVVSSGGVSVGDADFIRQVLNEKGEVNLWKIAMKPGRPLTFATLDTGAVYFGLPGNPVSGMVTFHQFVLPALRKMLGQSRVIKWKQKATLTSTLKKLAGRVDFQRGILTEHEDGSWEVESTGSQDSHVLTSMQRANCYIVLDMASTGVESGSEVETVPFANFVGI